MPEPIEVPYVPVEEGYAVIQEWLDTVHFDHLPDEDYPPVPEEVEGEGEG